jgi:hypothetical protein
MKRFLIFVRVALSALFVLALIASVREPRFLIYVLLVALGIIFPKYVGIPVLALFVLSFVELFEPFGYLLFGWAIFPVKTLPKMTFEPVAIAVGAAALALLVPLTHGLCRWLYGHGQAEASPVRRWRLRWSAAIVGIVVLMFASAISIIVTIHETGWLVTTKKPWFEGGVRQAARRMQSTNQLKQIGLGFSNYADANGRLPPGGTFTDHGEMLHSWETMLLPLMELGNIKPNLALPWNHPDNAKWFQTVVRGFINPGVREARDVDDQGYALSHYAVNSNVLGANRGPRLDDVKDGLSHTIMAGEVNDNFKPWGHPVNYRDPALGINKSPDGFGGPWSSGGAHFLLMDGSVRHLNADIDPAVLRAISTPNGGEKLPENWGD